jgi:hypothetical protein
VSRPGSRVRPELPLFLRLLAAHAEVGQCLDVRWRSAGSGEMRRCSFAAADVAGAAAHIALASTGGDVFVGVALRNRARVGGKKAITGSRLLYVDCDEPHPSRVACFSHPPTLVVASGTPGHLQLYWLLHRLAGSAAVEEANRRLALALCGDPGSTDIARVFRPPGTLNHKHEPPRPVRLLLHRPDARYELDELTGGLPADPHLQRESPVRARPPRSPSSALERALLAIPAEEYVRVLVNATPNREGKILCPFHEERLPSFQLYRDGTFYCFGAACKRGGSIFRFAGYLWNIPVGRDGYIEILDRLAQTFGVPRQS